MSKNEKELEEIVDNQGIEISNPLDIRPKSLPLVIKLPADASLAQIEYAMTLNGYAYKNPEKWAEKKDDKVVNGVVVKGLISKLLDLKNAPDPILDSNLKINKSSF